MRRSGGKASAGRTGATVRAVLLAGTALTGVFAAGGPAGAANLTVDTSSGNTPFTVSASATYDNILVGLTGAGTLILNNAAFTLTANGGGSDFRIGNSLGSTGLVTLSAGTITATSVAVGSAIGSTGTVNLDGGTLTTTQIVTQGGSSVLRLNGGTLQAAANQTAFLTGLTRAEIRNGGAIIDSNGFDITIGQALVHSTVGGDAATDGGLTKNGAGNLTLTGALSYTGLTTIAGGSIELGDATRSVTLPGNATLTGGNLAVANGSLGNGTITNNLGLAVVIGSLNGATATAGSATINSNGTVAFQNTGSAGTAVITSSGLVDFANNSTAGNAQIVNNGTAILQFRDSSTAANATITTNSGAPGGTPDGTGTLFAGNSSGGTSRQIVNAGGMLDISFVTGAGVTIGSLEGAGVVGLGNKTLTVGANNLSTSFSGIIQNTTFLVGAGTGGLTKIGTGTLTLGGTSTYAGPTNVNAGTLAVNGDISTSIVTVNTGGTLGGNGIVGSTTIASGGTLSPGNSIGTLNVNGNLTFAPGARYAVEVTPASADRVNVTGTAALAGTVQTSFAAGNYFNRRYTIVSANGGVLGTFGGLENTNLPVNFTSALAYDANNAYLDLTFALNRTPGLNVNQQQVANALVSSFNAAGGIPAAFAGLNANGLSLVSGETGAALQQSLFTSADLFMRSVFDNALAGGRAAGDCNEEADSGRSAQQGRPQDACAALPARAPAQPTWSVWGAGYGGSLRTAGDAATGSHETTSRAAGAAAGATYDVSAGSRIGFALGGAGASYGLAQGFGSGRSDDFNAALFGRHDFGRLYVAAALGYLWQQASTDRNVGADRLTASLHPQALTTRFEAGWRERALPLGLTPYAAVQTIGMWLPSYAESGGQFALSYGSRQVTAARSELGVRLADSVFVGGKPLTLSGRLAWVHGWNTDWQANAAIRQLVASNFTVAGAALSGDSALLSLGASLGFGRGWTVAATFDGEFWRNAESYSGRAIVQYQW